MHTTTEHGSTETSSDRAVPQLPSDLHNLAVELRNLIKVEKKQETERVKEKLGDKFDSTNTRDLIEASAKQRATVAFQDKYQFSDSQIMQIAEFGDMHLLSYDSLFLGIIVTLGWSTVLGWFIHGALESADLSSATRWTIVLLTPLMYSVAHPVIGRIAAYITEVLHQIVDQVYKLRGSDCWTPWRMESKFWFAVWWPIAGPLQIMFSSIANVYGITYKSLFTPPT